MEYFICINNIEAILAGDLSSLAFPDVSSSALQLQALTMGGGADLLYRLLNLKTNNTEYKNIYAYLATRYMELELPENLARLKKREVFTTKLAKGYAMPAAYGKKEVSCANTTDNVLAVISEE